ncbi:hypothetical protein A1Q2_00466 [Trichosporon asahii var. asahii CBS 8904]|uniref:Glucose-methanol-choline oxidoreductase N-terminal domain-containing protein n=2 Tax=Trichosporon asahii var. asahii TaxID=189963 RepID=K1VXI8_TRIAC|nr:hypothetical protein A1Q1_04815 [Trichosporon asahii var. asahii CBS 2479]EJT46638.1 hypothetical protein A1Q1_04815 [Trichosporon asahii var. asahii CBS 2479]EKD05236.1 hypothetical protein A1Q2_00466 [Trichosporon asahii var. asahii CBS 8904]
MTIGPEFDKSKADGYYDTIIVGGGTAGCVLASRLTSYLPHHRVLVIEGGPSDLDISQVLNLREWLSLLGGEYDYDYPTVEEKMGNSHIRHSRAKVLGGCSSHNTLISFRPFKQDMQRWEDAGAEGWSHPLMMRLIDKLRNTVRVVDARHQNQLVKDWVNACSDALGIPVINDFNKTIKKEGQLDSGVGFFSVSYNPDDGTRSSASVAYIHPILKGEEKRPNLTILTEAWVSKVHVQDDTATGVHVTLKDGSSLDISPAKNGEIILSAGAVDSPRLMLLSGLGPQEQLKELGIPVVKDLPGVGENLLDHPETIIMWRLKEDRPVPLDQTTMDSDAGVFLRREPTHPHDRAADMMMHCYQIPFTLNTERLGYAAIPERYAFCMTPNIPRPKSKGRLYLVSKDPKVKPALHFRYFTDHGGYDAATLVAGIKAAREVAKQAPFSDWLLEEIAPGPKCQSDEEISEYARRAAHTVYHPAGTTRMGSPRDRMAVVGPDLRVRGMKNLRVADAGVFPEMVSVNPMLTVLAIGERAAELMAMEKGWKGDDAAKL